MSHNNYELLAEVFRGTNRNGQLEGPRIESSHYGIVAIVDEDANPLFSRGNVHLKTYIRSAAKPFQILPLFESEAVPHFGFTPKECAVICGSHNGEPIHVENVRSILTKIGLEESHLQCGVHPPSLDSAAAQMHYNHERFTALHNNCSGKHAGMLACCVYNGWPIETYLEPDHPLQSRIAHYVREFSGANEEIFRGTDGCSAPVFYLEMIQMARMFAQLGAQKHPLLKKSFAVMRAEPYMIGGGKRFDTDLMLNSAVAGKVGGEGIHCVAVPATNTGKAMGIAVKIADGNFRALYPVVISLLKKLGALNENQIQSLSYYAHTPLRNHRKKEIGFIQSCIG